VGVGGSPQSVIRAARYGLPLMLAVIGRHASRFAPYVDLYKQALDENGHPPIPVGMHSLGFVAKTDEEAAARPRHPSARYARTAIVRHPALSVLTRRLRGADDRRQITELSWASEESLGAATPKATAALGTRARTLGAAAASLGLVAGGAVAFAIRQRRKAAEQNDRDAAVHVRRERQATQAVVTTCAYVLAVLDAN
jgi:hypothetical protein